MDAVLRGFREKGLSYLIVGPFAIVLAFPFYWMLTTALKTNGDLYNPDHVPFKFTSVKDDPEGHSPTFRLRRAIGRQRAKPLGQLSGHHRAGVRPREVGAEHEPHCLGQLEAAQQTRQPPPIRRE